MHKTSKNACSAVGAVSAVGVVGAVGEHRRQSRWRGLAWQDSRFAGGQRDAIAVSRFSDGGSTWSVPVQASHVGNAPAITPALHVREDGLVGLLCFDLRSDTADTATLLAAPT